MNVRDRLARSGRWVRDGWLIFGATLVLVATLEVAYRGQAAIRNALTGRSSSTEAGAPEPLSPFESTEWAADYWIGHEMEENVQWTPFVYIRNPTFRAPYAETDSLGHRVTPHPRSDAERTVRVYFMGGSTTFGWYQRAEYTIPAEAARRLQSEVGELAKVEVTNFGVPGHTFTQEIIELVLQLRSGARPDVVVFYDGINDVMATIQNGVPGLPQNEANRRADFDRGRALAEEARRGLSGKLGATGRGAVSLLREFHFVQRVLQLRAAPVRSTAAPDIEALAATSVTTYAENARLVEALAVQYGFEPIYVWQPALLSSRKPMTEREAWLRRPQPIGDLHEAIPSLIEDAVVPVVGDRFVDLTELFDDDPLDVYVDVYGHTYERANPVIVGALLPRLTSAVTRAMENR